MQLVEVLNNRMHLTTKSIMFFAMQKNTPLSVSSDAGVEIFQELMSWKSKEILDILDKCTSEFTFPMLDNGYVYLADTRMSIYRSIEDWAIVIEVSGFSPGSGIPDIQIYSFASKLCNRDEEKDYVNHEAYENYLKNNPNNEMRFAFPIENEDWLDENDSELISENGICIIRGKEINLPHKEKYDEVKISLEENIPHVFEFCRYLSATEKDIVLATENERVASIPKEMKQILQLDEWNHPDIVADELPSQNETFQQISAVLETGDVSFYKPTLKPNTDWRNWPDGGLL